MSVEHHADQICLVCDECGDNGRDFHASDFDEMVVEVRGLMDSSVRGKVKSAPKRG